MKTIEQLAFEISDLELHFQEIEEREKRRHRLELAEATQKRKSADQMEAISNVAKELGLDLKSSAGFERAMAVASRRDPVLFAAPRVVEE